MNVVNNPQQYIDYGDLILTFSTQDQKINPNSNDQEHSSSNNILFMIK